MRNSLGKQLLFWGCIIIVCNDDIRKWSLHERVRVGIIRSLPPFKGKSRLARWICGSILDRKDVIIKTRYHSYLSMPSLREPIAFHCLVDGIYEPEIIRLLDFLLPKDGIFLDIGANIGVYSTRASSIVGPLGKVVAVEASPTVLPYLYKSINANNASNVIVVPKAATNPGLSFVKFWPAPPNHFGMGAMAAQFEVAPVEIGSDTVDNILSFLDISRVDLIKIDIEGFEYSALQGMIKILSCFKPPIIFEFTDWAEARAGFTPGTAQKFLQSFKYKIFDIERSGQLKRLGSPVEQGYANLLAVPFDYDVSFVET